MVAILLLSYFSVPKSGCKDSDFHRESDSFSKLYVYRARSAGETPAGRRKVGRRQADKGPSGGWTDRQAADPAGILPAGRPGAAELPRTSAASTDCAMNDKKFVICRVFRICAYQVKRENGKVRERPVIRPTAGSMRREPGAGRAPRSPGSARKNYTYAVRSVHPHPTTSYTQGLQFADGMLWEGAGEHGESVVQTLDLETGRTEVFARLPQEDFGEGITLLDGELYQLHVAIEQSLCLRPGNRQENQGVPLSRRRLGTDHRRAEALHVGRHQARPISTRSTLRPSNARNARR